MHLAIAVFGTALVFGLAVLLIPRARQAHRNIARVPAPARIIVLFGSVAIGLLLALIGLALWTSGAGYVAPIVMTSGIVLGGLSLSPRRIARWLVSVRLSR